MSSPPGSGDPNAILLITAMICVYLVSVPLCLDGLKLSGLRPKV